jgi:hypothetical protein
LVRIQQFLYSRYLVSQTQSSFLEPLHKKFVQRALTTGAVYHGVKVTMFHAQLNQATIRGMQVGVHRVVLEKQANQ